MLSNRRYRSARILDLGLATLALVAITGRAASADTAPQTLLTSQTATFPNANDGRTYELGVRVLSDAPGQITAVRFWKSTSDTGTHVGRVWSVGGQLLAAVTFANESASGWQQQSLTSPLGITADTEYVVSVSTGTGGYFPAIVNGFSSPLVNLHLRTPANGGRAGSSGAFPVDVSPHNYFRDLVFVAAGGAVDAAPAVTLTQPITGTTVSGVAVTLTATATDDAGVAGVQFQVDGVNVGSERTTGPFSLAWDSTTVGNGPHTLAAVARDTAGQRTTAPVTVTVNNGPPPSNGVQPSQLLWNHESVSSVAGFAITIDNVRADDHLTPLASNGTCGCAITLPFWGGWHTLVVSAYNSDGESPSPALVVGPIANAGGPYSGQVGSPINFNGGLSRHPAGSIVSYEWTWGDGAGSPITGSPTASHAYASSGTFTLTLKAIDNAGAIATATGTVTVSAPSVVAPAAPANVVVGPSHIAWSHGAVASVTGFAITIDNVRSDYQRTPLAANGTCGCTIPLPFSGGRHTIVVSAYNAGGETPSAPVVVGPVANAGGPYAGQAGSAIAVTGSLSSHPAGSIARYEWTWGDGTANAVSASASASQTYASSGPFTLTLTVTDSGGATATASAGVTVSPAPPASVNLILTTEPPGLQVTIDGQAFAAPKTSSSVVGTSRSIGVATSQTLNGVSYTFTSWSDGGAATHAITTPSGSTTYTARFAVVPVAPPPAQQTLFTTQVPTIQGTDFQSPWDLGVAVLSDVPGQITAVRFWKNVRDTGAHVGRIFSATGQLLALVTFVNETASGWQQQALAMPVTIAANTEYVISVSSTAQFYAAVTLNGFASPLSNAHLRTAAVNAGRYGTLGGSVPTGVAPHNFFRDVVFVPTP